MFVFACDRFSSHFCWWTYEARHLFSAVHMKYLNWYELSNEYFHTYSKCTNVNIQIVVLRTIVYTYISSFYKLLSNRNIHRKPMYSQKLISISIFFHYISNSKETNYFTNCHSLLFVSLYSIQFHEDHYTFCTI